MQHPAASPSVQHFKARVTRLENYLKSQNILITHSAALEALSVSDGFADWNTASAALKQSVPAAPAPEKPITAPNWHPGDPLRDKPIHKKAPVFLLGNKISTAKGWLRSKKRTLDELWWSRTDLCNQTLLVGALRSDRASVLQGALYQAMLMGSGGIYFAGGDNLDFLAVREMATRLNRLDDLLVLNFLGTSTGTHLAKTHSFNPFAVGYSQQLAALIIGLLRGGHGDTDVWQARASGFVAALMKPLVYLRDNAGLPLNIDIIRSYLPLSEAGKLAMHQGVPESLLFPLRKYIEELPPSTTNQMLAASADARRGEQHGYIIMQITEAMKLLGETYRHAFSGPYGIDFNDVIVNRRIVVVLLPDDHDNAAVSAGLGRLVLGSIRSVLAPSLDGIVDSPKEALRNHRPDSHGYPFFLILDHYDRYITQGFAVVAAQARSLNVAVIFACADYSALRRANEIEAASTIANTSNKIIMKLADKDGIFHMVPVGARIDEDKPLNLFDLVTQAPGEAHILTSGNQATKITLFRISDDDGSKDAHHRSQIIHNAEEAIS